uniref:Uncharacterized protein n=1 Tax=Clytia hemisphaerica TaxID=252671 RepID=A0A7M5XD68_9CNID
MYVSFIIVLIVNIVPFISCETSEESCNQVNTTCSDCIDIEGCFWCGATESCHAYNTIPTGCSTANWFVGQCTIAGYWLIIVLPCVGGLLLLIALICCCWCCCCQNESSSSEERYHLKSSHRLKEKDKRSSWYINPEEPQSRYGLYNDSTTNYSRFDK